MERLLDVGFELAGHWVFNNGIINFELNKYATRKNVLYAFIIDSEVKYVGKTTKTLTQRMRWYRKPGLRQVTNIKNNKNIIKANLRGDVVDIYVLPDSGLMHYGVFHLNLAAGLEDSIIKNINPDWNGGRKEVDLPEVKCVETVVESLPVRNVFTLTLQDTYYKKGFFNVGVDNSNHFGPDGEKIELYLAENETPIMGVINRRSNKTGAPRIMGGIKLRNWFEARYKPMDDIKISVLSPSAIKID